MNKSPETGERINRYLAHCGLCSRREADRWIVAGRVQVNGRKISEPGCLIGASDVVLVDGKPVAPAENHTYIIFNKPRGMLCSRQDPQGRPLIFDKLEVAPNVQYVGRLDMDTEGLLLLTDDGDLARLLTNPRSELPREYRARVAGAVAMETLQRLRQGGLAIGRNERSDAWEVVVDGETRSHTWLTVTIRRGRWREVRRTLEKAGHPVRRLIRTRFGTLKLEPDLPSGAWRLLGAGDIRRLKASLNKV